jgi:hypothetical protein
MKNYEIKSKSALPHQQRVIAEANDLGDRVSKLKLFIDENEIFKGLGKDEQFRMTKQLVFMDAYFDVLKERIDNF